MAVHKLVKYEYQSGNREGLQHYVECTCGFQGRTGTKAAAESQFDSHLMYHSRTPYFSNMVAKVEEKKPGDDKPVSTTQVGGQLPAGAWKPEGAK